jgi:hypothetical protein
MAETLICKGCKAPKKIAECHKKLRSHRDSLANLASKHRTSFFREEDQGPAMRIAELLQVASDACDLSMLCLETGRDNLNDVDRMRARGHFVATKDS